jgi:hypothetical protein
MKKNYHLILKGKAQLYEPIIKLENIQVNISSIDGGVTWEESQDFTLEISGTLEIFMSCKAMSGTNWEFTVIDKDADKKVYNAEGKTGEKLDSMNGQMIPNYSERKESINQ